MNNEIIQTIDALAERLGVAVANAQPYAEDLCNRIITNTIVGDVMVITLFLILSVSAAIVLPKWWKVEYGIFDSTDLVRLIVTSVWIGVALGFMLWAGKCVWEIKDCLTIPEVVIINKLLGVSQ